MASIAIRGAGARIAPARRPQHRDRRVGCIAARRHDASDATIAVLRAASRSNPRAGAWIAIDATDASAAQAEARDALRPMM